MVAEIKSDPPCEVCSGSSYDLLYPVHDTNNDAPGEWGLVQCKGCGLGRLSPMPNTEEIASFYSNETFYTEDGVRFRPWMEYLRRLLGRIRGRGLNGLKVEKGALLDFGGGAGHFGDGMNSLGWDVVVYDPYSGIDSSTSAEKSDHLLPFEDKSFDAITLWYVIEHVENPREIIRDSLRVLKDDGILVLAQQDFGSYQARFFKDCWLMLDPPRHLFQFSKYNLSLMAEQEGYEVVKTCTSSIEMGPYTIFQSSLNRLLGNQNYLFKFLKNRNLKVIGSRKQEANYTRGVLMSLLLAPFLLPLSVIVYFLLQALGSGDVFTLYFKKKKR